MMRKLLCRVMKLWSDCQRDSLMKCWGWGGKKRDVALRGSMEEAWQQWLLSSQCAVTLGKSCLTNLLASCVKTARSLNGRRAVGLICVDFSFQHIVLWHQLCLECCSLDGWTGRSAKTYQGHWPRRVVLVIHTLLGIRLQVWFLWGYVLEPFLFNILISNPEQKQRKCPLSSLE